MCIRDRINGVEKTRTVIKDGTVLEEWITDGKPHSVEKLPVKDVYKRQKLSYDEMGKLQEVVRCLRQHGGFVNESCGQHVHVEMCIRDRVLLMQIQQ